RAFQQLSGMGHGALGTWNMLRYLSCNANDFDLAIFELARCRAHFFTLCVDLVHLAQNACKENN
ncbi:MAG: hypothetical protein ACXVCE_01770, partial [Bacteriovorax sp.]